MKQLVRTFEKDRVIFEIPSGLGDERKVSMWCENVREAAASLDKWVLLCIPDNEAGVTPAGALQMVKSLKALRQDGCQCVCILTGNTAAKIIGHALAPHHLGDYVILHESLEFLCQQAQSALGDSTALTNKKRN